MTEFVSRREFARLAGCNEKQVRRSIDRGALLVTTEGKLDVAQIATEWRTPRVDSKPAVVKAAVRRSERGADIPAAPSNVRADVRIDVRTQADLALADLDWTVQRDWSESAQHQRVMDAAACVGFVALKKAGPVGDGNWGEYQLRHGDASEVLVDHDILLGFGYERENWEVIEYCRREVTHGSLWNQAQVVPRPDLLHALAMPICRDDAESGPRADADIASMS
jgi:hypothetical protein